MNLAMSREADFIQRLRTIAPDPAARGLRDDAAVLPFGHHDLVITHDMLVEGVHYLAGADPADVAWKLVAVNLSDLAAKGARPIGVLLGYALARRAEDDVRFADGLAEALAAFAVPLLGGDTVAFPDDAPRAYGLTALGEATTQPVPARAGAHAGDVAYVAGTIGAAGLGLALARAGRREPADWLAAYHRPRPLLGEGLALAPQVRAMADVSDGLLIDAARMAEASGLAMEIDLDAVPVPEGVEGGRSARIAAVTAGDDYALLCAAPPGLTLSQPGFTQVRAIGRFLPGKDVRLFDRDGPVPLPASLGYEHDAA